ncbi:MAG: VOC family protein, partial [Candidatus Hydrogenedentes bacterium]|nr:VOC family protein [Candidatus Hydrogenedentota bacterium]
MKSSSIKAIVLTLLLAPASLMAQEVEKARFHHVHLNVTDPEKTIDFYRTILSAEPIKFRGLSDALFMGRAFILMNKVDTA